MFSIRQNKQKIIYKIKYDKKEKSFRFAGFWLLKNKTMVLNNLDFSVYLFCFQLKPTVTSLSKSEMNEIWVWPQHDMFVVKILEVINYNIQTAV